MLLTGLFSGNVSISVTNWGKARRAGFCRLVFSLVKFVVGLKLVYFLRVLTQCVYFFIYCSPERAV